MENFKAVPPGTLTWGQTVTGVNFNPSNNPDVDETKLSIAQIIDLIVEEEKESAEAEMFRDIAIEKLVSAQMWAVKFLTSK